LLAACKKVCDDVQPQLPRLFGKLPQTRLLVDAGLSRKETFERLAAIGVASDTLTAILITHEHCDHIAGLQVIATTA
jgi:metal-dependent hydrolase (beta-lactamase superfamily II)